jgi:hypothetical protein
MAGITREHLVAACAWAAHEREEAALAGREYLQARWDCGTACCIHGAAAILAGREDAKRGPQEDDYTDLPEAIRDGVLSVLYSHGGTPALVRRVLSGELVIGADAQIGVGARIADGAAIAKDEKILPGHRVK